MPADRLRVSPIRLKAGTSEDVPALIEVEKDAASTYRRMPSHAFAADLPARSRDEHRLVLQRGASFVAERDGHPVGFLLCLAVDGRAHILEAAVASAMQGKGIGSELLSAFERWAAARSFREATLTTYADVPWNAPFYARHGFTPFAPGADRRELLSLIEEEKQSGFWAAPRIAMRRGLKRSEGAA